MGWEVNEKLGAKKVKTGGIEKERERKRLGKRGRMGPTEGARRECVELLLLLIFFCGLFPEASLSFFQ